ncbi:MOSC domain-containing protein [Palleronia aestuarii]|uniref:MOSC domain-containing protein n=1 Tax=Palleronia aestuarii TaxID=568105 RepID=A0A2W7NES3_9RHOB|nr:MOSC domain-containing protein [Palleronia aestuarii]PZX15224.1 MOSC domain-containing protein [Palleronia aestuarii]
MAELREMMARHARDGRVDWIGLRPARREPVSAVEVAEIAEDGLRGDHGRAGKRAVTLVQAEHFAVVASLLGIEAVEPARLRRNIVVSAINLAAFRHAPLRIGGAILRIEGPCPPCSRMEGEFGPGGYSAIRGHGGYYASVVEPGRVSPGDIVAAPD